MDIDEIAVLLMSMQILFKQIFGLSLAVFNLLTHLLDYFFKRTIIQMIMIFDSL